jgi:hypothetical protein
MRSGHWRKLTNVSMTERESGAEIMMWLAEQIFELISFFKETNINYIYIFLFNKGG